MHINLKLQTASSFQYTRPSNSNTEKLHDTGWLPQQFLSFHGNREMLLMLTILKTCAPTAGNLHKERRKFKNPHATNILVLLYKMLRALGIAKDHLYHRIAGQLDKFK